MTLRKSEGSPDLGAGAAEVFNLGAKRFEALMAMQKLDMATLQRAHRGEPAMA